jgi:hypothetical protein
MVVQTQQQKVRTELDLKNATFKLRGLAQAACLNGNMPYLVGQPSEQARQMLMKPPTLFTTSGTAVEPNLSYQPPEVIGWVTAAGCCVVLCCVVLCYVALYWAVDEVGLRYTRRVVCADIVGPLEDHLQAKGVGKSSLPQWIKLIPVCPLK